MKEKIILCVNYINKKIIESVKSYNSGRKDPYSLAIILHSKKSLDRKQLLKRLCNNIDLEDIKYIIVENFDKKIKVQKALAPYLMSIKAMVCQSESSISLFSKIVPQVPYVLNPSQESLIWANNKIDMRRRFKAYDPDITPKYTVVDDYSNKNIEKILSRVGLPVVIKPPGLGSSKLISICYHKDELRKRLQNVIRRIKTSYEEIGKESDTRILVEQFMDGEMYSVDGYVNDKGDISLCPLVHVKTGISKGYNDLFGYMRITPTTLDDKNIQNAFDIAKKGIYALALRNTSFHTELMKTDDGWKIIEIGARPGGFRHDMYNLSYGINHTLNDILNKLGKKVRISKRIKGYTVVLQYFSKKEGIITSVKGIRKIKTFKSFHSLNQNKKIGDIAKFSRNGGTSVLNVVLFNKTRSGVLADVRRCDQAVKIIVDKK